MNLFRFFLWLLIPGFYACGERHKDAAVITTPDYKKGQSFLNQQNDSAFYYFNKAATNSKDSLQIAMAYSHMAILQTDAGDYYGGQENLLLSLKYLKEQIEKDRYCLVSDYNELGSNSLNLKNYDAAIEYYTRALKFANNDDFRTIASNNLAVAYQKKRQYAQAIAIYQSIINRSKKEKNEYARVLSNLARVRWLQDSGYRAAPDLLMALQIRKDEKDLWGLNASYAHLSDYYFHSRPDSALLYAEKMYAIAQQLSSPDDELEALQKLLSLSPPKDIKQYFIRYQSLNDSIQTSRNAAKNQFALIRYDAERNKADNIRLQKENTEKKLEIVEQQIIIYGSISLFLVIICAVFAWYRKRKRRLERQFRENELKTSQKVHDVVANGLYAIMMDIEHQKTIEKEQLLDKIESLYEQSRNISYVQSRRSQTDFKGTVTNLLSSFADQDTKILIAGNDNNDFWNKMEDHIKEELELVLKELMINMKKHSSAQNVAVKFERQGDWLNVQYTDDGVGLPSPLQYGNGLSNTGNRINSIGGRIIFDKNTTKGVKIQVHIPIV